MACKNGFPKERMSSLKIIWVGIGQIMVKKEITLEPGFQSKPREPWENSLWRISCLIGRLPTNHHQRRSPKEYKDEIWK